VGTPRRTIIFHYHLFKNAGTSVDELLRRNFSARWTTQEFGGSRHDNAAAAAAFIRNNPHLKAISSHTALLPLPRIEGVEIIPIIFIRHPIDRLRSAYEFERKQKSASRGARLAKTHDFASYLTALLQPARSRQVRNFQTYRLSMGSPGTGNYRARALDTINTLPFVGLVDAFGESIERLTPLLKDHFPDFTPSIPHINAHSPASQLSLAGRLAAINAVVGDAFYEDISRRNADDLHIHEYVSAIYGKSPLPDRQSPVS
jgi:hypothetical protein